MPDYKPVYFVHPNVVKHSVSNTEGQKWADPENFSFVMQGGKGIPNVDDLIEKSVYVQWDNRQTFCAESMDKLVIADDKGKTLPRNPVGRTGMQGRGLLGKWGPNQAADPIVTCLSPVTGLLCMVAVLRDDTKEWAIPGGMVIGKSLVTETLKKGFGKEAAENSVDMKEVLREIFDKRNGVVIYEGYVDDPRNTDNAWMETTVVHYHCLPHQAERLKLSAGGGDTNQVSWLCIEDNNERYCNLYASHRTFVDLAVKRFREQEKARRRRGA